MSVKLLGVTCVYTVLESEMERLIFNSLVASTILLLVAFNILKSDSGITSHCNFPNAYINTLYIAIYLTDSMQSISP